MDTIVEHKLLAIVSVDHADRIQCGQPGCGHSVYRQIHVVKDGEKPLVLGSTCFAKRYGSAAALGSPRFGGGGGRPLTAEERSLLVDNTALLLTRFEEERARTLMPEPSEPLTFKPRVPLLSPESRLSPLPAFTSAKATPWKWAKPLTSMAYFKLKDGTGWVRIQRTDGKQLLVPWPTFEGWDEALPANIGLVDSACGGYVLANLVATVKYLRSIGQWDMVGGVWRDIAAEVAKRATGR
ncbi:MAG: hypothetical protein PSV40_15440 [Polaromonas sp.]|uniref:hypothetical protein n=1 Tax=Polaromonas sp. TaxID=1869339 RepID=UPI002487291F|nr:hypothetical protein [Polaromonas sp.]MDI1270480.1 hypothetical protein [Polaromonas sp.]